ncbi:slit protein, putative [Ixodes scapularis]|uniref:Slit protein, putative n=1 Tax=Ixodes scapularis TaxID=6945 RepID=B7PL46_IXOSC|nr:slit protein, putative [Ixodes scapularis]|eukprot:XP_002434494.1 slit protein, putative [Ixodes scapularis]
MAATHHVWPALSANEKTRTAQRFPVKRTLCVVKLGLIWMVTSDLETLRLVQEVSHPADSQLMENQIETVHEGAFADLTSMERLDLSHNRLAVLGQWMLHGSLLLKNLTLNRNNLTTLGKQLFEGMPKLRVVRLSENPLVCDCRLAWLALWLQRHPRLGLLTRCSRPLPLRGKLLAELHETDLRCEPGEPSSWALLARLEQNRITEIPSHAFAQLKWIRRIDLSGNLISKVAPDAFSGLTSLTSLHLARNPFICDCNLRWLATYLHQYPVETSGARCESPKRMHRRRLTLLGDSKFKCKGSEEHRTRLAGDCIVDRDCPESCVCEGTIVDCSRKSLREIPSDLPTFTTELDLRNNAIADIEDNAFLGAEQLADLLLMENKLRQVRPKMFSGLSSLRTLMLRSNQLSFIANDTFADLTTVRLLSLYDNKIRCLAQSAFERLTSLRTL